VLAASLVAHGLLRAPNTLAARAVSTQRPRGALRSRHSARRYAWSPHEPEQCGTKWRAALLEVIDCAGAPNARSKRGLTFDMSGGPKGAKRPLERPLDGGVRLHFGWSRGARLRKSFHLDRNRHQAPNGDNKLSQIHQYGSHVYAAEPRDGICLAKPHLGVK
jgi:hypothetical protein